MRCMDDEMDWANVAAVSVLARKFGMTPREWLAQLDLLEEERGECSGQAQVPA